ncbi:hypothetical protein Tco_1274841 [Tanacetum coccineum]
MDGRGAGSCIMLGFAPSGPSFSVSPSMRLSVASCGGSRKGGSCVLIPDLVVMAKVGALGSGVSLLLIDDRIWEYCSSNSIRYCRSDRILGGKDHCRCLLQTSIPARMGCSTHIHQPHGILRSNRKSGYIASEIEETLMKGDGLSQRSSWYWTYSSILFHPSSLVRELKRNWMSRESTVLLVCSVGTVIGFWKPEDVGHFKQELHPSSYPLSFVTDDIRNQATIQNGQVTVLNVQGRQSQGYVGSVRKNQAIGQDHVDAYDSDCDDKATANAIFMESLSLVGLINDDTVGPPYDSNIFSENGVDLDEEQLLFLAGGQTNTFDDEVDEGPVQDMA